MPDAPTPPAATLSYEADLPRQLLAAETAWRPVRRAVRWATFDAWTLAVFAALSMFGGVGGVSGILLGVALAAAAVVEFVAVRRLRRLDPAAARWLAVNQLALAAAVVLYAGWNLYLTAHGQGVLAALVTELSAGGASGPETAELARSVVNALYASLAVVGGLVPILTAWFYASRARHVRRYVATTPAWIVQMHRDRGKL